MDQTTTSNTDKQLFVNSDTAKLFVWNNRFDTAEYTNGTGSEVTLAAGTVLGRISASGKVTPFQSDASDGSQTPIAVLASDYTVANGATVDVTFCKAGDVAEGQLVFTKSGDDLDTAISGKIVRDLIQASSVGINLVSTTEMTEHDNS